MELAPIDSKTVQILSQEGVDPTVLPTDETVKNATQAVAPLLRGNIDVTAASGENTSREIELPELDKALNGSSEDLEKLIALLMLESDEKQVKSSMDRLKAMLEKMDAEQQKVLQKLAYALQETKKVEEAQKKAKALGWLMLGLSILATVITSVVTFGAGSAGALAIVGCVASIAATTLMAANQITTACGGRDARIEERTKEIMEKEGCSKKEAKEKATKEWDMGWGIAQGILAAVSMVCGIGEIAMSIKAAGKAAEKAAEAAGKAVEEAAKQAATKGSFLASKSVQTALKIAGTVVQAASAGVSVAQAALAFKIAEYIKEQSKAAAEMAELQAFLQELQAAMDEEEDTLKQLLLNLQSALEMLATLLGNQTETLEAIMANFNTGAAV